MRWFYYQCQKYSKTKDLEYQLLIKAAPSPKEAAALGRDRACKLREDWDLVKDNIMREVVRLKFEQHPDIFKKLKETGDATLIEDSPTDYYWGCGKDGTGKNMLGKILMEIRDGA